MMTCYRHIGLGHRYDNSDAGKSGHMKLVDPVTDIFHRQYILTEAAVVDSVSLLKDTWKEDSRYS